MRNDVEFYNVQNFSALPNIIQNLFSNNFMLRRKAKEELLEIGEPGLDYLIALANSKDDSVRWESIKIIDQIGSKETIGILISALEDSEFSLRWLASESIINRGKRAIEPLLQEILNKPDSVYLQRGAHHILKELRRTGIFKDNYGLVEALANEYEQPIILLRIKQTLRVV